MGLTLEQKQENMRKAREKGKARKQQREKAMAAESENIQEPNPLEEALAAVHEVAQPAEPETVTVPLTMLANMQCQIEELKAIKTAGGGMTFEQLAFLLQEMKKPDAETQKKLDDEKARIALNRKNMIELALLEEQKKAEREANCNHKKDNGRSAVVGQVHSDGLYHGICQHCQHAFTPSKPTTDMLQMGTA